MMGTFSQWLDGTAQHFGEDQNGRMAFLPHGRRHACYYIDAADESQLKALVRVYTFAAALINAVGSVASFALTEALTFSHGSSFHEKFELFFVVYLICSTLFFFGPALILKRVYRNEVSKLCTPLPVADPASLRLMVNTSSLRMALVLVGSAMILLALGLLLLVPPHHH
jgi:hypothetical protein